MQPSRSPSFGRNRIPTVVLALTCLFLTREDLSAQEPRALPQWHVDLAKPLTEIGDNSSNKVYWRTVAGVVRLESGELLVADSDGQVLRFSARGEMTRVEMRRGNGPSELPGIGALLPVGELAAAVFNSQFLLLGGPTPIKGGIPNTGGPPSGAAMGVLVGGGVLQARVGWKLLSPPTRILRDSATLVLRTESGTDTLDRVPFSTGLVFAAPSVPQGVTFGKVEGAPQLIAAARDSIIWYGVNSDPSVTRVIVRNNHVVRKDLLSLALPSIQWSAESRAAWLGEALRVSTSPEKRALASALWSSTYLPTSMPRFRSLASDVNGAVWVEVFPGNPTQAREFVVHSIQGKPLARVTIPPTLRIAHLSACCLTAIQTNEDDLESVVVYSLRRTP